MCLSHLKMWSWRSWVFRTTLLVLMLAVTPDFILALRNVSVTIPLAVKRGDNAILICNYDIENDTLYTVKWYRGRREFYRYTPKENPAWKIFSSTNGLNVDITHSNASHVFLRNVSTTITGRYACEVSADAPSFHTSIMWGEMDVIEFPTQRPIITGVHSRYRLGDVINGNCSSDYSKPAANLTWWINDIQVPPNYLRTHEVQRHAEEQLESSILEINFIVTLQHFIKGKLKLKCSARIHRIYHAETEKYIEEDRPRILASGRSPETFPYDHNDEFDDENGLYLTHYKRPKRHIAGYGAWLCTECPTFESCKRCRIKKFLSHTERIQLKMFGRCCIGASIYYPSSAQSNLLNLNSITRFMYLLLPTISSLFFAIVKKNVLYPLGLGGRHQRERQRQQQLTTSFVLNHKANRLPHNQQQKQEHPQYTEQQQQQQQQQQQFRYCHINYPNSNNYADDYDYKHNGDDNDYNNNNQDGGTTRRKSSWKRNKNETRNCRANIYTDSQPNGIQMGLLRHVLR